MAQYDLSRRLIPNLDRHLVRPILEFLESECSLYPAEDLMKARYELLKGSDMINYLGPLVQSIKGGPEDVMPEELVPREKEVMAKLEELNAKVQPVMDVFSKVEKSELSQDKARNAKYFHDTYKITSEQLLTIYQYGQYLYTVGLYGQAADYLNQFRPLVTDPSLEASTLWGKLACSIFEGDQTSTLSDLDDLHDLIKARTDISPALQLQQRTWFLHWSLFVYFTVYANDDRKGRQGLLDRWVDADYRTAIQSSSPWLLRYLVVALILSRTEYPKWSQLKDQVVKILQQEVYQYSDPVTEFLRQLEHEVDFDKAMEELKNSEEVLRNDFFLNGFADEFRTNARYLLSEAYCKVHHKINIGDLSDRLGLSRDDGEQWIVDLVRSMHLDARIDFKENTVYINQSHASVYQSVIDRTKSVEWRSNQLAIGMEQRAKGGQVDREGGEGGKEGGRGGRGGRGGGRGGRGGGRGGRGGGGGGQQNQQHQQANGTSASTGSTAAAGAGGNSASAPAVVDAAAA